MNTKFLTYDISKAPHKQSSQRGQCRMLKLSLSRTFAPGSESSIHGIFVPESEKDVELSFSIRNKHNLIIYVRNRDKERQTRMYSALAIEMGSKKFLIDTFLISLGRHVDGHNRLTFCHKLFGCRLRAIPKPRAVPRWHLILTLFDSCLPCLCLEVTRN